MWSWDAPGNPGFMCENHDIVVSGFVRGNLLLRSIFQLPTNKDFTSFVFDWLLIMSQIKSTGWFLLVMSIHEQHLGWHVVWFLDHSGLYSQIIVEIRWVDTYANHFAILRIYSDMHSIFYLYIMQMFHHIRILGWCPNFIGNKTKVWNFQKRIAWTTPHPLVGETRRFSGTFFLIWFLWMKNWGESGEVRLVFLAVDDWILRAVYGWWCWMCFLK